MHIRGGDIISADGNQGFELHDISYYRRAIEYAVKDKNISKFDEVVLRDGAAIFIDPKASMFLIGSQMIYKNDELNSGFDFVNPNEKGRCGCGESFKV